MAAPDWAAIHRRDREIAAMTPAQRKVANRIPAMCGRTGCGADLPPDTDTCPTCGATF